jgi:hypothetical protein
LSSDAFWEDISIAYINSWQSTKRTLAAKAERAIQKQRKLDVHITLHLPIIFVSDDETTLSLDLGQADFSNEQLAGVKSANYYYDDEVTPKKKNTTTPSSGDDNPFNNPRKGYLFTPNKSGNGPSSFLSPVPTRGPNDSHSIDISKIFESPYELSSLNGSFSALSIESGQRRRRGWSMGNSKLFSVAENEEATAVDNGASDLELIKCFYDYFRLSLQSVVVSISTSKQLPQNLLEAPSCDVQIAKSTIPSDASLCKYRFFCVVDRITLNMSNENVRGIMNIFNSMKLRTPHNNTRNHLRGSHIIFPAMTINGMTADDEDSSVNEDEFLEAISEFQPDDASIWFDQHWAADEGSVGDFTNDASFARTPSSRRHRFPSISEVSSGEEHKVYLSPENLLELDESTIQSRRRPRAFSQISGDEDSFHSVISLDNQDELVKAIQDDIKHCERDIDLVKTRIKSMVDMYNKENWRGSTDDIKRRRHHKQKLKSQLLRLEGTDYV